MCVHVWWYLQELHHVGHLIEHLLQLVQDDVVAVAAARVGPDGAQGEVETVGARVPLDCHLMKQKQ